MPDTPDATDAAGQGVDGRPPLGPLRNDGLPTLATGEPVLARWFVIVMLLLVPAAIATTIGFWSAIDRDPPAATERQPVGDAFITMARGDALFPATDEVEDGPSCMAGIALVGDSSARAASRRALLATCQLLRSGDMPTAVRGLERLLAGDALMRVGTFERSGVDASMRLEDERLVLELNARYLFEDATRAAPNVVQQLALLGDGEWPGDVVSAQAQVRALGELLAACRRLSLPDGIPRPCLDAQELLGADDPVVDLVAVGYRDRRDG